MGIGGGGACSSSCFSHFSSKNGQGIYSLWACLCICDMGLMPLFNRVVTTMKWVKNVTKHPQLWSPSSSSFQVLLWRTDCLRLWNMYLEALNADPTDIPDRWRDLMCLQESQNKRSELPSWAQVNGDNMTAVTAGIHQEEEAGLRPAGRQCHIWPMNPWLSFRRVAGGKSD